MSLNKNDKEARNINLEHAKWLDNSSNQIQEVEMQDGSKEENNSKKPKLSIHSKALKIIAGGVILVVGIGIGSMVTRGSENVPVDSASSISNSMPSEDEIATSMSGAEVPVNSSSLGESSSSIAVPQDVTFQTDPRVMELTQEYLEENNLLRPDGSSQLTSEWGITLDLFNDYPYEDYSKEAYIFWGLSPYYVVIAKDQEDVNHVYLFETDNMDYVGYDYLREEDVDLSDSKQIIYLRYPLLARTGMTMDKSLGDEGFLRVTESTKCAMVTVTKQGFVNGVNLFLDQLGETKTPDQFGSDGKILVKE